MLQVPYGTYSTWDIRLVAEMARMTVKRVIKAMDISRRRCMNAAATKGMEIERNGVEGHNCRGVWSKRGRYGQGM